MTKVDLEELERGLKVHCNARMTRAEVFSLIARIRELETGLRYEGETLRDAFVGEDADEHEDLQNMARRMLELSAKGCVLP